MRRTIQSFEMWKILGRKVWIWNMPSSVIVRSWECIGDGVADDTTAINNAISSGGRCAPFSCESSTTSPAVVYFPAGTFRLTGPLIDYYETQLIGNPNCLPVLKPSANFTLSPGAVGIIDGSPYGANGLGFQATNTFYRQIRNFILDMTDVPSTSAITGIHWPTAQSTSLQNVVFHMSDAPGTQHRGMLIEDGKPPFFHPPPIKAPRNIESFELGEYWYTHEYVVDHGCTTQYNSPSPVGMKGPPEHHALYQYQFAETLDSFVGLAQTESSYAAQYLLSSGKSLCFRLYLPWFRYSQPNPNATMPFPPVTSLNDPNITASSDGQSGNSANGWGLRILDSENILIYGLSLYSFFNNYNTCGFSP